MLIHVHVHVHLFLKLILTEISPSHFLEITMDYSLVKLGHHPQSIIQKGAESQISNTKRAGKHYHNTTIKHKYTSNNRKQNFNQCCHVKICSTTSCIIINNSIDHTI